MVNDVLQEAASRRHEAAAWLRKILSGLGVKDLPEKPTEEEFLLALRSGIILCNALNHVHPGTVPKVVEVPVAPAPTPDGAALKAYQYFENIMNFLVAAQDKGLPTFETSDLEKGDRCARVVNCVLALKSYFEWRQLGGAGTWKYRGNLKAPGSGKHFIRKFECRMDSRSERVKPSSKDFNGGEGSKLASKRRVLAELTNSSDSTKFLQNEINIVHAGTDNIKRQIAKHNAIFERQEKDIQELKKILHDTRAGMQIMQTNYAQEITTLGMHMSSLVDAASRYPKVLEENRRLHNVVQDLKGNIRVYCRVRPFLPGEQSSLGSISHADDGSITVVNSSKYGKAERISFTFNKVFGPSSSQEEIYSDTQALIRSVLDGYNVCIFAYGQTGSGKTHTMMGPTQLTEDSRGVNYRALTDLFQLAEQRKETIFYQIAVQMIEIYNEQVKDLLVNDRISKKLEIRSSLQRGLNVPNASLVPVKTTDDVIKLMSLGQQNRSVGATALNNRSSRSHSCLMVHVKGRDTASGTVMRGCMHLVDLAGSERVQKSEVARDRMKEAQHINKSLSALGDVIAALAQKNSYVPYRNTKLTQLLHNCLGGQAKTLMFVHVSPERDAVRETISTLKFAERVSSVELGAVGVNKDLSEVKDLKDQIANLKVVLARKEAKADEATGGVKSTPSVHKMGKSTQLTKSTAKKCVGLK